jgi:hypothetical protein
MKQIILILSFILCSLTLIALIAQSPYLNLTENEVKNKFKEEGFRFDKEETKICYKDGKTCKVFIAQSDTEIIKCRFEESKGICNAVIRYKK